MKFHIALVLIAILFVGCQNKVTSGRRLASVDEEELLILLSDHYKPLGYTVTAYGELSLPKKGSLYHVTLKDGVNGCSQVVRVKDDCDDLTLEYLGNIDCR